MKVVFRADSSVEIGSGHMMRCLTLADALQERGARTAFICRDLPGNATGLARQKGHQVYLLPGTATTPEAAPDRFSHAALCGFDLESDLQGTIAALDAEQVIDWLVVDHYAIDACWEAGMRRHVRRIMVIDDLADRPHDCDLLLDQNLYEDMGTRYNGLVPGHCRLLLGPRYALLRPEFMEARKSIRERDGHVRRILIFFGGSDSTNETAKALEAILYLNKHDLAVDVVVGLANPKKLAIHTLCSDLPRVTYHCQTDKMAGIMAKADFSIGAGGSATWERCCLGLPTLVMTIAPNQVPIANAAVKCGLIFYLGCADEITVHRLAEEVVGLLAEPAKLNLAGAMSLTEVDGAGTRRVAEFIENGQ